MPPISLDSFLEHGFVAVTLNDFLMERFIDLVQRTTWVGSHDIYSRIPNWYENLSLKEYSSHNRITDQKLKSQLFEKAVPKEYKDLLFFFANHSGLLDGFQNLYSFDLSTADLWDGAEDLGWHWDGIDAGDIIFLLYFSNMKWEEKDGGQVETGKRSVDGKHWLMDYSDINTLHSSLPNNGNVLIINNRDPRFVHRVRPMKTPMERIVLTAGFKMKIKDS